jgi:hypothetical protein
MSIDLTGGLDLRLDGAIVEPPEIDGFGENHAFWIFDDEGRYAILHQHLNAPASAYGGDPSSGWTERTARFTVVMPEGRRLAYFGQGAGTTEAAPSGGLLTFRRDEPFKRWTGSFSGRVHDTTAVAMIEGTIDDTPEIDLSFEFEAHMAAPPWSQGSLLARAGQSVDAEGMSFIGGQRYEQLFRGTTTIRVDETTITFSGTGMRTHRWGGRNTATMIGHSWLTALFPSGRAFGLMRFPRPDGSVGFSEGFVFTGDGDLTLAEVLESPWLTNLVDEGEAFVIRLRAGLDSIDIHGVTVAHTFNHSHGNIKNERGFTMSHGMVRFVWDGETAFGQIERSGFAPEARL